MNTLFLKEKFIYSGPELRSLFLFEKGLKGDGMIAWIGPCDVKTTDLVDAEDRVQNDFIKSKEMIHFLAEFFHKDVFFGICIQRLMAEIVIDVLSSFSNKKFERQGDDVYLVSGSEKRKLNVSIATVSPLSTVIHFGVNIDPEGAPVVAVGLKELGVDSQNFTETVLNRVEAEVEQIHEASVKVMSV
jgi:hypothetical protein